VDAAQRARDDRKRHVQFALALMGGAWVIGAAVVALITGTAAAIDYACSGETEADSR
jgi:hypothetical protein